MLTKQVPNKIFYWNFQLKIASTKFHNCFQGRRLKDKDITLYEQALKDETSEDKKIM